ncbi:uroporphyrinogen-III synthase [Novosphingobium piscinae]|uniref:Uroporphyrinogen-III synthase n=1 Tax=Novosphingobium piscinae TaxID=1507448 RepID=A0A7X1G179_9SPHN|nr:uroporphyrinogen-III synthase [Novosphingobium piscinae]MBC2670681.1 uroporphyrinogen-III synthase [Novosphingobium piscinae]
MAPLIVIRPEPGTAATVAAAAALGLEAIGCPLFEVVPRAWALPVADAHDALLVGSANVFRMAGADLAALRHLPVHAVGATTATAARAAGFAVAATGTGGLQAVLDGIAPETRLLRLAGAERVSLVPPPGVTVSDRVVYASEARALPPALVARLAAPAVIALHSAEAARHFAAECTRCGLARAHLGLVTIGPRASEAAGTGWAAVVAADMPAEAPLLAKARDLCHTLGGD